MIKCIIIAEEDCDGDIFEFQTQKEVDAFAHGVQTGANMYGAGGCTVYSLEDLEYLNTESEYDANAIKFINKFLGEKHES